MTEASREEARQGGTFEERLRQLEEGVRLLEAGEVSLDQSLVIYEAAVGHLKACHEILGRAERRVKILSEDAGGNLVEEDFTPSED